VQKPISLILILLFVIFVSSQDAMIVSPSGNIGIGTGDPRAELTVKGRVIREVRIATGLGPDESADSGRLMSRTLTFVKQYDETAIRITYTDVFRAYSGSDSAAAGSWEIRCNDQSIPGGQLIFKKYIHSNAQYNNDHDPTTVLAFAEGLSAGIYEIQIWVAQIDDIPANIHTGWRDSRWTIEAEEVWISKD
jgi:hypothetical protein